MLSKATRRYSLALYQAAQNEKKLDAVAEDSNNLIGLLGTSRDLKLFFHSPVIPSEKKTQVVEAIFKKKISALSFDFIKLLIQNNRENLLVEILGGFLDLKNESEGKIKAEVKTAVDLDDKAKKKLTESINSFTGKKSIPEFSVDKSLVGGFTIKVKDVVVDASIKRQLENLRNKFKDISIK
jgi:F-type H+-transporting ATPase subunit delta